MYAYFYNYVHNFARYEKILEFNEEFNIMLFDFQEESINLIGLNLVNNCILFEELK